ncbi:MAG TPA: glycosyltransferase family 4 protein, partial [Chloroflexi bacterium]|nr:glycosyltransferase family 4 protein [Chloroflexota bacterium]
MRIAIITSTYPRFRGDGVGSFIHSLSQALVQHGHHLTVLAPYDPDVTPGWPNEVKVKRVHYIWPKSWAIVGHARSLASDVRLRWHAYPLAALFALSATLHLYREVRNQQTDIIYAQWLLPGGFIGAIVSYLTGIPLVVSLHGSDVFLVERYPAFRPVARFVLHKACHVIACSTDLARRVLRLGLSSESVSVIPYGVDHKRFTPLAPKAKLPVPNNHHIVMAIGRLVRKKGFSFLLEAAPLVLARHPDVHFVIAGDGDLKEELRNLAVSLKIQEHV